MDVHLRDLRYFLAVAEELHFTRAAERLFMSQPALSKQIRQLERSLGAPLFQRDPRGVSLTPMGVALLPAARELTARWDDARQALSQTAQVLTVGFPTSIGRGLLNAAIRRFKARRPDWRFEMRQIPWDDPSAGLGSRSTDVAVLWAPLPEADLFRSVVLKTEPVRVALPEHHRLASRRSVRFADLRDESFLALPLRAGPARDFWLGVGAHGADPPTVAAEVRTADETFEAVANHIGIVLLAAGNARLYRRPGVVTRPVRGLPDAQLLVAWRADDRRQVVHEFVEAMAAAAGSPPSRSPR
jgi:DNA-binding transcriptional LysR family regulator